MSTPRKLPLLPAGSSFGWTPYAWLIYLPTFFIEPVMRAQADRLSLLELWATSLGTLLFLVTYFRGYWVHGRQLQPIFLTHVALGIAFAPFNSGSSVFFVYAASFAAFLEPQRVAWRAAVLIALAGLVTAFATSAPLYFWLVAVIITLLVGSVNVHFAAKSRAERKLHLARQEIEQLAAVAERERIARDMHDVLGHTLSLIVLKAELARRLIGRDAARAAAEIADVENVARRTLQEVREAIRGYQPTVQDEVVRARVLLRAAGIADEIDAQAMQLPPMTEHVLALALREAVTNVVRHAAATRCVVRLRPREGGVLLEVSDDGRGMTAVDGAGLHGMRERVEGCGGRVERASGRGTTLRVWLPAAAPTVTRSDDVLAAV